MYGAHVEHIFIGEVRNKSETLVNIHLQQYGRETPDGKQQM